MQNRVWIAVLAVLSVLVHALAVVRHNTAMVTVPLPMGVLAAQSDAASFNPASAPICHSGSGEAVADADPAGPIPSEGKRTCPMCLGMASPVAFTPDLGHLTPPASTRPVDRIALEDERVSVQKRIRPPSRGPPALG